MIVYITDDTGMERELVVIDGLHTSISDTRDLTVVRAPQSSSWIVAGLGYPQARTVSLDVLVSGTAATDVASSLDAIRRDAEAATWLYVQADNGYTVATPLKALSGVGNASPLGAYAYRVELKWLTDRFRLSDVLTDDAGTSRLTQDGGGYVLWEVERG